MKSSAFTSVLVLSLLASVATAQERKKPSRVAPPPPTHPPLVAADLDSFPDGTDRLDLFLLIGQSNMKGRGQMPETAKNNPRIIMMHLKTDGWYRARHPLHITGDPETFEGHDNAGVGPGLAFAEAVAAKIPTARIGLIPCAMGGSPISSWSENRGLYRNAIRRARLALESAPTGKTRLSGVLWLQGEADTRPELLPKYAEALHDLVDRLRRDLKDPDLPFLAATIGEMRADRPKARKSEINRILLDLPKNRPHTACVDARDLKGHIGDSVHYDTASQEEIGRRFARLYPLK